MLTKVIILSVVSCLCSVVFSKILENHEEFFAGIAAFGGFIAVIAAVPAIIILMIVGANTRYLEDRIQMVQEENDTIEGKLDAIVEEYLGHESDTFEMAKGSGIDLVTLYPELKA